jgi:hypothetical protein
MAKLSPRRVDVKLDLLPEKTRRMLSHVSTSTQMMQDLK